MWGEGGVGEKLNTGLIILGPVGDTQDKVSFIQQPVAPAFWASKSYPGQRFIYSSAGGCYSFWASRRNLEQRFIYSAAGCCTFWVMRRIPGKRFISSAASLPQFWAMRKKQGKD